mmetsp:Transcript_2215/g.4995  ORF Transcript_2215/g.4995 Transcript_2215/m.4995 type:complete len:213 (+) Transcript_2215:461-1099(+)
MTAVARGPSPCTLPIVPFKNSFLSLLSPLETPRFNNCSFNKLLATMSATSASHPSTSECLIHAADGETNENPPLLLLSLLSESSCMALPPVSSKLNTSSSSGMRSMGSDSNDVDEPGGDALLGLLIFLPTPSKSSTTPNSPRNALSTSVIRGTNTNRNNFSPDDCCCCCFPRFNNKLRFTFAITFRRCNAAADNDGRSNPPPRRIYVVIGAS